MSRLNPLPRGARGFVRRWQGALDEHVIALAWSPDRTLLAAAAVGGPITVFEAATGTVRQTWSGHGFGTAALSWRPGDNALVASVGQDGKAKLWQVGAAEPLQVMPGGASWVERVAWSPNGQYLATAAGKKLRVWNAQGELVREYPDHPSTISDLQWRPGTQELASSAYGCVQVWKPESSEPLRRLEWKGSVLTLAWSPNGRYLATGDQDATVHFWVLKTGEDLQMSGYMTKVRELAWDSTSRWLVTGGGPVPCAWDCSSSPADTTPISFDAHEQNVSALAYQHKGPYLVSGGEEGLLVLWQPGKYKIPLAEYRLSSALTQVKWSSDDRHLALGTDAGDVVVLAVQ